MSRREHVQRWRLRCPKCKAKAETTVSPVDYPMPCAPCSVRKGRTVEMVPVDKTAMARAHDARRVMKLLGVAVLAFAYACDPRPVEVQAPTDERVLSLGQPCRNNTDASAPDFCPRWEGVPSGCFIELSGPRVGNQLCGRFCEPGGCPQGSRCINDMSTCLKECGGNGDCPSGTVCTFGGVCVGDCRIREASRCPPRKDYAGWPGFCNAQTGQCE